MTQNQKDGWQGIIKLIDTVLLLFNEFFRYLQTQFKKSIIITIYISWQKFVTLLEKGLR